MNRPDNIEFAEYTVPRSHMQNEDKLQENKMTETEIVETDENTLKRRSTYEGPEGDVYVRIETIRRALGIDRQTAPKQI